MNLGLWIVKNFILFQHVINIKHDKEELLHILANGACALPQPLQGICEQPMCWCMVRTDPSSVSQLFPSKNLGKVLIFQPNMPPKASRHQTYILVIFTFLPSGIWEALEYSSLSYMNLKFVSIPNAAKGLWFRDLDLVAASLSKTWDKCTWVDQS